MSVLTDGLNPQQLAAVKHSGSPLLVNSYTFLKSALILFDVSLLDHLIIGDLNYFSFADENLL